MTKINVFTVTTPLMILFWSVKDANDGSTLRVPPQYYDLGPWN